jgi:hypothetical protein
MDDKTKNIQPEIENLNLDEIDVEELEKRLELAAAATDVWICGIYDNQPPAVENNPVATE